MYVLSNPSIPVGDFANTGEGIFSKIRAGLRSKSKILKTWRVLELCLDMESSIKKKSIFLFPCPFNYSMTNTYSCVFLVSHVRYPDAIRVFLQGTWDPLVLGHRQNPGSVCFRLNKYMYIYFQVYTNNTKESHVENIRVLPKLGGEKYENTIIYVSTFG